METKSGNERERERDKREFSIQGRELSRVEFS